MVTTRSCWRPRPWANDQLSAHRAALGAGSHQIPLSIGDSALKQSSITIHMIKDHLHAFVSERQNLSIVQRESEFAELFLYLITLANNLGVDVIEAGALGAKRSDFKKGSHYVR